LNIKSKIKFSGLENLIQKKKKKITCEKACIWAISSFKALFTSWCLCKIVFPSKIFETILTSKFCPHPPELSLTSYNSTNIRIIKWKTKQELKKERKKEKKKAEKRTVYSASNRSLMIASSSSWFTIVTSI